MTGNNTDAKANLLLRRGSDDADEIDYPWPWHHEEFLRAKLLDGGDTPEDIADDWGCSERTIWRQLKRHGLEAEYRRRSK